MMRKIAIWSGRRSSDSDSLFSRGACVRYFHAYAHAALRMGRQPVPLVAVPVSLLAGDGIRWGGSRNEKASFNLR